MFELTILCYSKNEAVDLLVKDVWPHKEKQREQNLYLDPNQLPWW